MKGLNSKIVEVDVSKITPYEGSHNVEGVIEMLRGSIKQFGVQQPIILDKNNVIVAGNGVYKAAILEGYEKLPCVILDNLTKDEIAEYRIADNKTSEFASWNEKKLRKELSYLQSPTELQFCFDENIKAMLGMDSPLIPRSNEKKSEQNKIAEEIQAIKEKESLDFKQKLKSAEKDLMAKPKEYVEYTCSKCGKLVVIKQ